jgi:hypothetical protein
MRITESRIRQIVRQELKIVKEMREKSYETGILETMPDVICRGWYIDGKPDEVIHRAIISNRAKYTTGRNKGEITSIAIPLKIFVSAERMGKGYRLLHGDGRIFDFDSDATLEDILELENFFGLESDPELN